MSYAPLAGHEQTSNAKGTEDLIERMDLERSRIAWNDFR